MKKRHLLVALSALVFILAACGGQETAEPTTQPAPTEAVSVAAPTLEVVPTPEAAEPTPTLETAEVPQASSPLDTMDHTADPLLTDKTWEWVRRDPNGNASDEIVVSNPENYTLLFNADATFNAQLDCNSGAGAYKTDRPGSIFMELGPMTAAACGDESLSDSMMTMFGPAQNYRFEDDNKTLVFGWVAGGPLDYYQLADGGESSAAEGGACSLVDPALVQIDTQDLPYSWQANCVAATPYDQSMPPGPVGLPEHIQINFGQPDPAAVQSGDPLLYMIPVEEYRQLWDDAGNDSVSSSLDRLQAVLADPATLDEASLSTLPFEASRVIGIGHNELGIQRQYLELPWGTAVRSIAKFQQDANPITNQGLYYIVQGLTHEGRFLVSFFYPVTTEFLWNDMSEMPQEELDKFNADSQAYIGQQKVQLDGLADSDWTPPLTELDAVVASLQIATTSAVDTELVGTTWHWLGTSTPVEKIQAADPARYSVLFNEDGTANIKADCNDVLANYTLDGSSISITMGPSTLAACAPDSQDQLFLQQLGAAAITFFQDGDLFIDLFADSGTMRFTAQEIVDLPEPEAGEATGTVTAPDGIFLRTGPGSNYPYVGTAALGDSGKLIGISEDGQWYLAEAPDLPGGEVWGAAEFVEATNAENLPVVGASSGLTGLVGPSWQWQSLSTPVAVTTVGDPTRYEIVFNTDGTANIKADCNNVLANYTTDGSGISIVMGPTTLAACAPDSQDQLFLQSLSNSVIYFFQSGDLLLDQAADSGTMRLSPAADAPAEGDDPTGGAAGRVLEVVSFGPQGAEQAVIPGTTITALFDDQALTVVGSAGCNDYNGGLTPVADYFTVGPIAVTRKLCSEPAGIMEQEQAYLTALGSTTGYFWETRVTDTTSVVTAGRIIYTLTDGTVGNINYAAR